MSDRPLAEERSNRSVSASREGPVETGFGVKGWVRWIAWRFCRACRDQALTMMRKFLAKTSVVDASGRALDYTATVRTMDRDICRALEKEAVDSDQTFYNRYIELHRAKHRETFEPVYRE